jgi:hypothetical protein
MTGLDWMAGGATNAAPRRRAGECGGPIRAKTGEIAGNIKPISVAWNFVEEADQEGEK